jgi:hypothetical protein
MQPVRLAFHTGFRTPRMAQALPSVNPTMPAAPSAGPLAGGLLGGAFVLALGAVSTIFYYGLARESKSKLVKTPGYIVAAISALGTLITAGGMIAGASK